MKITNVWIQLLLGVALSLALVGLWPVTAQERPGGGTSSGGGGSTITYVSKLGSDVTGTAANPNLPFLTVSNAAFHAHAIQTGTNWQTVYVYPGVYTNDNNLGWPYVAVTGAAGFNLYYDPPASDTNGFPLMGDATGHGTGPYSLQCDQIYYSKGTNSGYADTGNQDPTGLFEVYSAGISNCQGAFVFTNAASSFALSASTISYLDCSATSFGKQANCFYLINGLNTSITVKSVIDVVYTNFIYTTNIIDSNPVCYVGNASMLWWGAGRVHMHCDNGYAFANPNGFWLQQGLVAGTNFNTEQDFFYEGDELDNKVYTTGSSLNAVSWFNVKLMSNPLSDGFGVLELAGGKNYFNSQKLNLPNASSSDAAVNVEGGSNWVTSEKISSADGWAATSAGGLLNISVMQYEDLGGSAIGFQNDGGNLNVYGGTAKMLNGIGIKHITQTNNLTSFFQGVTIDTSAGSGTNKWPADVFTNGLILSGCALISPAGTLSIFATNAQTVSLQPGAYLSTNASTNITFAGQGTFATLYAANAPTFSHTNVAPANTTTPVRWLDVTNGGASFRIPLYQ